MRKREIQPSTSHFRHFSCFAIIVSIAENFLECFIVSLIYQEMRAVLRGGKRRKHLFHPSLNIGLIGHRIWFSLLLLTCTE